MANDHHAAASSAPGSSGSGKANGVATSSLVKTFFVITTTTLSLAPIKPFGYPVTFALIALLGYVWFAAQRMTRVTASIYLVLILYLLLNAWSQAGILDVVEFGRTFGLVVVSAFTFISSFSAPARTIPHLDLGKAIVISSLLIIAFEVTQIAESLLFGSSSLWFILDPISISTADDIGRFEAVNLLGFYRPVSFFHEPSYLAAVLFVLLAASDRLKDRPKWLKPMLIGGVLLTLSATIIFFLLLYVAIDFIVRRPIGSAIIIAAGLIAASGLWTVIYELSRIGEIYSEGSSGWTRLVLPLQEFRKNLLTHPLGIALGQSEFIFDNSAYLLMSYFGILFPPLIVAVLAAVRRRLPDCPTTFRYYAVFLALLFLNGAILTVESGWLLLILNLTFFGHAERAATAGQLRNVPSTGAMKPLAS